MATSDEKLLQSKLIVEPKKGEQMTMPKNIEPLSNVKVTTGTKICSEIDDLTANSLPPTVYGELSILGYNGYIPNVSRRNRSKFLLCKRSEANGIKKSRHYIVKQPQATKAIQDKDLHSISYTFSRSQTIIVEYRQDENTDMFQIGRSSEDPIDFVVMDTLPAQVENGNDSHHHHRSSRHQQYNENDSSNQHFLGEELAGMSRYHRHLSKGVGANEMLQYPSGPLQLEPRNQQHLHYPRHHQAAVLLNYPQPNISNLPPMMAEHLRSQDSSAFQHSHHLHQRHHHHHHPAHSSGAIQPSIMSPIRTNGHERQEHSSNRPNIISKRSHATQSTISRFACRILVDRKPPYTARIYAAGFDSSKNIFLGEKATKWEQNNSIDGLTTNGVLLMHPKQKLFFNDQSNSSGCSSNQSKNSCDNNKSEEPQILSNGESTSTNKRSNPNDGGEQQKKESILSEKNTGDKKVASKWTNVASTNDSNNNSGIVDSRGKICGDSIGGGVWREVSVDGGIYAIRESRSAAQKGTRIESETNILEDGTLIDLCGATLLWRSVEGFRRSPTKKTLDEKIDMLNARRPQCPVGLNTLIIPRKPIVPQSHRSGHKEHKNGEKSSHQPYVYLKCGHVQGYHEWGATEKSNQRTCPICYRVGTVAKLSMGLEPSFYLDSGPLTHVFNPCAHMASERTVKYWCSIKIPHGTHFFHSICPFCAAPLTIDEPASIKLIFQDNLD